MVNPVKLGSPSTAAKKHLFRFDMSKDCKGTMQADKLNGNSKWNDLTALEINGRDGCLWIQACCINDMHRTIFLLAIDTDVFRSANAA
jgi:hypothetical protein